LGDPLPELHAIELTFLSMISELYEDYPDISDEFVFKFSLKTAEYSKELNNSLKIYAKIDYFKNQTAKVEMKTLIKFAYDLLSLLLSLIKNFESNSSSKEKIESQIEILYDFIDRKQKLISTTYH